MSLKRRAIGGGQGRREASHYSFFIYIFLSSVVLFHVSQLNVRLHASALCI